MEGEEDKIDRRAPRQRTRHLINGVFLTREQKILIIYLT